MIPIIASFLLRRFPGPFRWSVPRLRPRQFRVGTILLLPVAAACMALSSCGDEDKPTGPQVTDTKPVGDGLTVVGFAIVGAAVVVVMGRLVR